jgi:hypothetical protein
MGDAVMPKQSGRKIITNRQLNFTLSPVDTYNPKEMPYRLPAYKINGTWNDVPFKFNFLDMLDEYAFLDDYRNSFKKILKKASETKFKLNYKIKYIDQEPTYNDSGKMVGRGRIIDIHYNMHDYQSIFDVDFEKKEILLNFNTPLGKFVIHNTLILDTDWCPYEALSLSNNAYFLYKRFVMNKRMGKYKAKEIPLEFEDIKRFLDLNASLERHDNKIIVDALKDMERGGLMKSFNAIKRAGKRRYVLLFEYDQNDS